jgi:hypothetical protein
MCMCAHACVHKCMSGAGGIKLVSIQVIQYKNQKYINYTASSDILTNVIPVNTRVYSHVSIQLHIPNKFLPEERGPGTQCVGP